MFSLDTYTQLLQLYPKNRQRLRAAKDAFAWHKARAEERIITAAGGWSALGSNQTERERALTLALEGDDEFRQARQELREAEYAIDQCEAEIKLQEAYRRHEELEKGYAPVFVTVGGVTTPRGQGEDR